ncbi:MAG: hypothetical protein JWN34_272 [Bryobacterales bacterium]|jgi:hypothetical protein|nr:hypothetical protein [Bryobacterales bacterium]
MLDWRSLSLSEGMPGWVFQNPAIDRPYHQEQIQKPYLKAAGEKDGLKFSVGWHNLPAHVSSVAGW